MDSEDTKSRSAPAGGSGGGTQDKWTEEDFKQRVRERLDRIEGHGKVLAEVVAAVAKAVAEDAVAASA